MASVILGYPLEMIMSMGGKGGGNSGGIGQNNPGTNTSDGPLKMPQNSGMQQFVIAQQRARSNFFKNEVKHIFMMANAVTLRQEHQDKHDAVIMTRGRLPSEREALAIEARYLFLSHLLPCLPPFYSSQYPALR